MKTEGNELKQCPFCGNAAEWVACNMDTHHGMGWWQCAGCACCSPPGYPEVVTEIWNTRTHQDKD